MDERSLADVAEVLDTSRDLPAPAGFDLDAWLAGVRPTRRSVRLFASAHLVAEMEQIAGRVDALPDGPEVDALIERFEAMQAEIRDGVWWTVEKRSSEWITKTRADAAKRYGLDEDTDEGRTALLLHQLAAQIVTPEGVTYAHLRGLLDSNEGELNKLIVAMTMANNQIAEAAKVVGLDFSSRHSGRKAGSSGR